MKASKEILLYYITQMLNDDEIKRLDLLVRKKAGKKSIVEVCFDHMIRWYAQVSDDERDSYAIDVIEQIRTHRISKRLADEIDKIIKDQEITNISKKALKALRKEVKNKIEKEIHYEHNVPVEVIKRKIIALYKTQICSFENVKNLLEHKFEVILITKQENNVLSGAKDREYVLDKLPIKGKGMKNSGEFDTRLSAISATLIDESKKTELIKSFEDKFGNH